MIVTGPFNTKEVYYDDYCKTCKYRDRDGTLDPCNECLTQGWNIDSHRPINYILSYTVYADTVRKEAKEKAEKESE